MREILFRGKAANRIDGRAYRTSYKNGDWVYGLLTDYGNHLVSEMTNTNGVCGIEVDKNTIGQFTGMTDKNDTKIFEGDIVKDESGVVYPVVYGLTGFYLKYAPPHSHGFHYDLLPLSNYWHAHGAIIEVIGNIHDNLELLEG